VRPAPGDQPPATSNQPPAPAFVERIVALIEVLVCSDYPTQLAIGATFTAFGYGPYSAPGHLRLWYVVGLSIADTVALITLVLLFLAAHGERAREVFIGTRSVLQEAAVGVPMILVALGIGLTVIVVIQRVAPSLHTVPDNPFQTLLRTRSDAWLLALVVVVAGGVREEIQRAFLLHRFEVWLGGGGFGIAATSVAFGSGHLLQGADAAIATGLLGAFWGLVYLRRRSMVAPMVSHAGFDLAQIAGFLVVGR
jgi:membrane protease YdiL (CAAX protease family)